MDERQSSIIAQSCMKAACELFAGSGALSEVIGAAETLEEWCHGAAQRYPAPEPVQSPTGGAQVVEHPQMAVARAFQGCPKCGGEMWDNRGSKPSPKSPDFKCKNKACSHAIWLNNNPIPERAPF